MNTCDVTLKGSKSPTKDIFIQGNEIGNLSLNVSAKEGGTVPPAFSLGSLSVQDNRALYFNLSYVGNLTAQSPEEIVIPPKKIGIFARFSRFGRGQVGVKYNAVNQDNLRRGGRKELQRDNLTAHARRMIQGVGDYFEAQVNEGGYSSVMVTLTYGRNVPDDKTAKRHLQNLIKALRRKGHLKYYGWVAQLQTGERAKEKGLKSYRAENGSAIHFHILTDRVPVKLVRQHWCRLVNDWERKEGKDVTKLGGVDIRPVWNASNYISKYISRETKSGTIKGSLWGISTEVRKEIGLRDTDVIDTTDQEWSQFVSAFKIASSKYDVRDIRYNYSVKAVNDWNDNKMIFAKNCPAVLREFTKFRRNQIRIKQAFAENKKSFPDCEAVGSVMDCVCIE